NSYLPWLDLGDACRRTHQRAEATQAYKKALDLTRQEVLHNPQKVCERACTAYLLARLGRNGESEYEIAQALALPATDEQARRMAVRTYEALGRREQALSVLEHAPAALIGDIGRYPDMADLGHDPRFRQLVAKREPK